MTQQIPLGEQNESGYRSSASKLHIVRPDLAFLRTGIVNVIFYGDPHAADDGWVLIDTGIKGSADSIREAAHIRFAAAPRPRAIVLTHGHFDHIGNLEELVEEWGVPVYAHPAEYPYLNGSESYPPANALAGGGMMTLLSPLYPRGPIDVSRNLIELPANSAIPEMPGWRWLHTPGHSPGHISLWREADRTLIAGDAFITTAQESAYSVLTQRPEMHGPPKYFTSDWTEAGSSVRRLADLEPEFVVTGHGPAMRGPEMREALHLLAARFEEIAVPHFGR